MTAETAKRIKELKQNLAWVRKYGPLHLARQIGLGGAGWHVLAAHVEVWKSELAELEGAR